jgi:hypothetical protein
VRFSGQKAVSTRGLFAGRQGGLFSSKGGDFEFPGSLGLGGFDDEEIVAGSVDLEGFFAFAEAEGEDFMIDTVSGEEFDFDERFLRKPEAEAIAAALEGERITFEGGQAGEDEGIFSGVVFVVPIVELGRAVDAAELLLITAELVPDGIGEGEDEQDGDDEDS